MSKRHSHGSSKKSSSKQHRHSSHKHRSQSESNNSNGVDALHVDHDQLGGAANNGSTSCRNFGSGIQTQKFGEPFLSSFLPVPWIFQPCSFTFVEWSFGRAVKVPVQLRGKEILFQQMHFFISTHIYVCERLPKKWGKNHKSAKTSCKIVIFSLKSATESFNSLSSLFLF